MRKRGAGMLLSLEFLDGIEPEVGNRQSGRRRSYRRPEDMRGRITPRHSNKANVGSKDLNFLGADPVKSSIKQGFPR
jgi:hypothetical protein